MALPGDLTTCAVTGTYLDSAGFPARGRISFTPSAVLADATGGVVIPMVTRSYQLSGQGTFTTEPLVATDASTIAPQGWTYTVQLSIAELPPQSWSIALPHSGSPVDISGITPVVPQAATTSYLQQTGGSLSGLLTLNGGLRIPSGAANGDVLTSDSSGNAAWEPLGSLSIPGATSSVLGGVELNTDLSGTATAPQVVATHLASPLPIAQGGTNAGSAGAALTSLGAASASALTTETSRATAAEALLAPLASPALTGTPTAPTKTALTNSTALATTAYADAAVAVETSRAGTAEALALAKASNLSDVGTRQTALNNLAGAQTSTQYLRGNGTNVVMSAIQAGDVPTLNQNTTGTAAGLSSTLAIGSGGTGQTTQQTALDALAGAQTSTQYLRGNGTHVAMSAIQAGDVPTLNQNTTGTAAGLSSTLALGSGGTGQTSAQTAMDALAGATTSTQYLRGNGTHVVMSAIQAGDVPTLNQNTSGTAAGLSSTLAIGSGGTGQTGAAAAFNALSPMTTTGDLEYESGTNTASRLAVGSTGQILTVVAGVPAWQSLDGTAGDIQPTSTAAVAGNSTKAAAANHVHAQTFLGVFGNGSDGSVTFDGTTTILGLAPSSLTYTLTRDIQCTAITINATVIIKTGNYRIFCAGTVTNNGTIKADGNAASGSTAGAVSAGATTLVGGRAGGAGGTGASGAGAAGSAASWGAAGGAGGAGTSGAAGAGGAATASVTNATSNVWITPVPALSAISVWNGSTLQMGGAAGGGGGGSDASSNAGGGGGGGGGMIIICAWAVNNGSGTITAVGGAGGNGAAGNAGGGGGGSGGFILAYTLSAWTAGTTTVTGGAKGNKAGTGSDGNAGGTGTALNVVLA